MIKYYFLLLILYLPFEYITKEIDIFSFVFNDINGNKFSFNQLKNKKAVLIVNVASECGYTDRNYRELQSLYDRYETKGLEIIGFPCNQFGGQEPHSNSFISNFLQENYHITFPVLEKVMVNGPEEHPLFTYLKNILHGTITNDIKWNFTKFLIVNGKAFKRYSPQISPFDIENDIKEALSVKNKQDL